MVASDTSHPWETVVVVDGKGDIHQKLSPIVRRHRPNTSVMAINLTNPKRTTHAWNSFAFNLDSRSALEDAQSFCAASQTRPHNLDSPFWMDRRPDGSPH